MMMREDRDRMFVLRGDPFPSVHIIVGKATRRRFELTREKGAVVKGRPNLIMKRRVEQCNPKCVILVVIMERW